MRTRRTGRWSLRALALLATLWLAACGAPAVSPTAPPAATTAPTTAPAGPPPPLRGRLIQARDNQFTLTDFTRSMTRPLPPFPAQSEARSPAWAPDGQRLAYAYKAPGTNEFDLYLMDADGSNARLLLAHQAKGESLDYPVWTPDGQALYYTRSRPQFLDNRYVSDETALYRLDLASGVTRLVASDASEAHIDRAGRLVYVVTVKNTFEQSVWLANPGGSGARELTRKVDFQGVAAPRLAPDGRRIAFVAVGQPLGQRGGTPTGPAPPRALGWLAPAVAEAHQGAVWDLWQIDSDGSGLQRLTSIYDDLFTPAWSPDGALIAYTSTKGLFVIQPARPEVQQLVGPAAGHAQLDWRGD